MRVTKVILVLISELAVCLGAPAFPEPCECDCDVLRTEVRSESQKLISLLITHVFNTEEYNGCSQEEVINLVRVFLHEMIPALSEALENPNPVLPPQPPFEITCEAQKELKTELDQLLNNILINFKKSEICRCPVREPLQELVDLGIFLLSMISNNQQ
ncbi:hypothetical protein L596_008931 [Steinernema carpocapsae]|uniref:Interleukin n=1 Tax=Steinernema carpocapsae TaxID=34508 RepID=A0A4U5PEQ2_STECR|nr:hypothetical protein L596_008931 [Steinernema carpocapsae]